MGLRVSRNVPEGVFTAQPFGRRAFSVRAALLVGHRSMGGYASSSRLARSENSIAANA